MILKREIYPTPSYTLLYLQYKRGCRIDFIVPVYPTPSYTILHPTEIFERVEEER